MPPGKGTQVRTIRVDEGTWEAVTKAATKAGITNSEWVRGAIGASLDREGES